MTKNVQDAARGCLAGGGPDAYGHTNRVKHLPEAAGVLLLYSRQHAKLKSPERLYNLAENPGISAE